MSTFGEGQCGLCKHFGEDHPQQSQLKQIRKTQEAPADFTDECGHPQHAKLHLLVTPTSGCDGFELAPNN